MREHLPAIVDYKWIASELIANDRAPRVTSSALFVLLLIYASFYKCQYMLLINEN